MSIWRQNGNMVEIRTLHVCHVLNYKRCDWLTTDHVTNLLPITIKTNPNSPFPVDFKTNLLLKFSDDDDETTVTQAEMEAVFSEILKWLCSTPKITYYRVNTIKTDTETMLDYLKSKISELMPNENHAVKVEKHFSIHEVIILYDSKEDDQVLMKKYDKEIVVDVNCAVSILRGAHLYAPGVLGMFAGVQIGDYVSIFADLAKQCRKGLQKPYTGAKLFIGNGIVQMPRWELFQSLPEISGIAVRVMETISKCPSIGDDFFPTGTLLLQNFPSIVCSYVLDPQIDDVILDMCASPGNKTTHIAALIRNQGTLIAIDKTPRKVANLQRRCNDFNCNVKVIQADSTKLIKNSEISHMRFNRILLDAPCSALGKRPQLLNTTPIKVLRSYVPLQRKLFKNAVELLKVDGILVYSTCTITLIENEGIVAWALRNFPQLELVDSTPRFGNFGLKGTSLNEQQLKKLQRFGPEQDSVGFFIAKFIKRQ